MDFYAVEGLPSVLANASPATYAQLTGWVADGVLTFPDDVVTECKTLGGAGDTAAVWVVGVAGSRVHKSFPGNQSSFVLGSCPDLLDVSDPGVQSHIGVASMATHLKAVGYTVQVVSEDTAMGLDRWSLEEACCALGIPVTDLSSYCASHGI